MSSFNAPASYYMHAPVHFVHPEDPISQAHARISELGVSSLAVVSVEGTLVGVISRSDLLRVGRMESSAGAKASRLLSLPDQPVSELMTTQVYTVEPGAPLKAAADLIVEHHIHRVFVASEAKPVGVLSTKEIMTAIWHQRVVEPVDDYMSSPVLTVKNTDPVSSALEKLDRSKVSSVVVVDGHSPVGHFAKTEALEARDLAPESPVDSVMSHAILSVKPGTRMHKAAAQAATMNVKRVIVARGKTILGILTGTDFARAAR